MPSRSIALFVACVVVLGRRPAEAQQTAAPGATIAGQVLDSLSRRPVSLVEVTVLGTALRASTDLNGRFTIATVAPGTYALEARRLGYEPVGVSVRIEGDTTVRLVLTMARLAFQLAEIAVTPGSFSFMGAGTATRQTMSRTEIESAPQFGEDIFRAVNRLPGLSSGDYSAHFSIRGGRHDETLILLDGLELYEPYHMKDFAEGAISIIDIETIEGVELMTGGFSARYGDRRSGVFSLTSRAPTAAGTRYSLGLSFTSARALAEGTFANQRGSWLVSARRGYVDLVLGLLNQNDLPSPRYYDVFAAARYNLHPRHALSFNLLHAGDRYTFDADATTGFQDSIRTRESAANGYGNSYAWLTLQSLVGPRLTIRTMASAGLVTASREGTERYLNRAEAIYAVTGTRDFPVYGFKQDWTWEQSDRMVLGFGYDVRALSVDYALTTVVGQSPDDPSVDTLGYYPVTTQKTSRRYGSTAAVYLSDRVQVFEPLTLELGLRYDRASYTNDRDWSPRVNVLLRLSERSNLRAGWGYYRQRQGIADLAALDGLNRYFPSELSKQWTLGFEHGFQDGGTLRVEGYYKTGSRLRPDYRNWKGGLNVFPETDEDRILVFPGRTSSKGIELYHSRNIGSRWSVRGSYALAFTEEHTLRIDNLNDATPIVFDPVHPSPQDQRHALNLDGTYRLGQTWSLTGAVAFHSGWPATTEHLVQVTGPTGAPDVTVKPDKLYGSRLPDYYRLDLRITRRKPIARGELRFFLDVVNITNHRNVLGYDYFKSPDPAGGIRLDRDSETWFTILPSLGVSWSKRF
jgi:outer membrane receptor protein involved in Fe transport